MLFAAFLNSEIGGKALGKQTYFSFRQDAESLMKKYIDDHALGNHIAAIFQPTALVDAGTLPIYKRFDEGHKNMISLVKTCAGSDLANLKTFAEFTGAAAKASRRNRSAVAPKHYKIPGQLVHCTAGRTRRWLRSRVAPSSLV